MARTKPLYCYTCNSDEAHRTLTTAEKTWLKDRTGRRFVEDFFMCTAPGCRNLRTGFDKHPFTATMRVPEPD